MSEYTVDEAFGTPIDLGELTALETEALLPDGTYTTTPPGKHKVFDTEDGTKIYAYFFKATGENVDHSGYIRVKLAFNKTLNKDGKPAWAYRLGTTAVRAFMSATEEKHPTEEAVAEYLDNFPVRLSVTRMEGNDQFPPNNLVRSVMAYKL